LVDVLCRHFTTKGEEGESAKKQRKREREKERKRGRASRVVAKKQRSKEATWYTRSFSSLLLLLLRLLRNHFVVLTLCSQEKWTSSSRFPEVSTPFPKRRKLYSDSDSESTSDEEEEEEEEEKGERRGTAGTCRINDLPRETLNNILQHVGPGEKVGSIRSTCRTLRDSFYPDEWIMLHYRGREFEKVAGLRGTRFSEVLEKFVNLPHLNVHALDAKGRLPVQHAFRCGNLEASRAFLQVRVRVRTKECAMHAQTSSSRLIIINHHGLLPTTCTCRSPERPNLTCST